MRVELAISSAAPSRVLTSFWYNSSGGEQLLNGQDTILRGFSQGAGTTVPRITAFVGWRR